MAEVPIFFENDGRLRVFSEEWTILTKLPVVDASETIEWASTVAKMADDMCRTSENVYGKRTAVMACGPSVSETQAIIGSLNATEEGIKVLLAHQRHKRGADFIGEMFHWAFGTMDHRDADEVYSHLEELDKKDAKTYDVLQRQVTVMSAAFDRITRPLNEIATEVEGMQYALNHTMKQMGELDYNIRSTAVLSAVNTALIDAQGRQTKFVSIVDDLLKGKLHPSLITKEQLDELAVSLPDKQRTAWSFLEPVDVYSLAAVRLVRTKMEWGIVLKIPLPEAGLYNLYRLYILPLVVDDHWDAVVETTYDYLAESYDQTHYLGFSKGELEACNNIGSSPDEQAMLCRKHGQMFGRGNRMCEISVIQHEGMANCKKAATPSKWGLLVELGQPNWWLYSFRNKQVLSEVCGGEINAVELHGLGTFEIPVGCVLTNSQISLEHRVNVVTRANHSLRLPLWEQDEEQKSKWKMILGQLDKHNDTNSVIITQHTGLKTAIQEGKRNFDSLETEVIQQQRLRRLEGHQRVLGVTGLSVGGIAGAIGLLSLLVWLVRKLKCNAKRVEGGSTQASKVTIVTPGEHYEPVRIVGGRRSISEGTARMPKAAPPLPPVAPPLILETKHNPIPSTGPPKPPQQPTPPTNYFI